MTGAWSQFVRYHVVLCTVAAFALDALIGDPQWMPHPVRGIGRLITALEKRLRRAEDDRRTQQKKGAELVVLVLLITGGITVLVLFLLYRLHPAAGLIGETILCTFCLAAKDLKKSSLKVEKALKKNLIETARKAVSRIVGRDTAALDKEGITKAAVETVAENTSDGVIAPLLYMLLGGALGGMLYKAVNTMDSMLGYKNEAYRYFGTAAAKLDDAVNYIPSRISALALIAAAYLLKMDGKRAMEIWERDRRKHASPNSAQTESACAGALGLQLAGPAEYFGVPVEKPYIGDPVRQIRPGDITRVNWLMITSSMLVLIVFAVIRLILQAVL